MHNAQMDSRLRLTDVMDTLTEGMMLVNSKGRIVLVNDALCRMTGFAREELMDQPCSVLRCDACEQSRAEGREHWCRLFNTRKESLKSCHICRKDGSYIHVIKNASLLTGQEGEPHGAVETITDISELDRRDLKIRELSRRLEAEKSFHGLVGESPAMQKVFRLIERAAQSDAPVIIFGESGTGKELAAHAIHELGPRRDGPFVQINCAAFNEALLESEIFGHVKGAFTGAYRHRTGRFEEAEGGDVFLDEVGDIPLPIQVKLLRVLETKRFERVGDSRPLPLDARIISATNQDLAHLVEQKRFRQDFFFRINVIPLHMPPLRQRREDIPLLARHFLEQRAGENPGPQISGPAMSLLTAHHWPGNVRELKSALEYALVVCDQGPILPEHLPPLGAGGACPPAAGTVPPERPHAGRERDELVAALRQADGNKSAAARLLGVTRLTVQNRMRKHGLDLRRVLSDV